MKFDKEGKRKEEVTENRMEMWAGTEINKIPKPGRH